MRTVLAIALSLAVALVASPTSAFDASEASRSASPDMYQPNVDRLTINGGGSAIDPMRQLSARSDLQGKRGPFFIWNNPTGNVPAGQSAGFQVWIGDNPTGTPGSDNTVGGTVAVINGGGRKKLYGLNVFTQVCNTSTCGPGYTDAHSTVAEFEAGTGYPNTSMDPWGGEAFRKNVIEITAQSGSAGRITSGMEMWANDSSGVGWFNTGIALSRVYDVGILAKSNPNSLSPGTGPFDADQIRAFQTAFIYDNSDSNAVLKVGPGSHNSVIDMTSSVDPGYLIRGRQDRDSSYAFGNNANYNFSITIDAGASAQRMALLTFGDRGVARWITGKQGDGSYIVFDRLTGTSVVSIQPKSNTLTVPNLTATQTVIESSSAPPASSSVPCVAGQRTWDANFEYRCVATNHWRRTQLVDF